MDCAKGLIFARCAAPNLAEGDSVPEGRYSARFSTR